MLYHNPSSIRGIANHIAKVTYVGGTAGMGSNSLQGFTLAGVMNNKEIEIPLGTSLTNEGDMKGVAGLAKHAQKALKNLPFGLGKTGIANKISKKIDSISNAVEGVTEAFSDITGVDLSKRQAIYTVVRPDTWSKPSISFTCTFYRGMVMGGYTTPTFAEFTRQLAKAMLPNQVGLLATSILESNQLSYVDALQLIAEGMAELGDKGTTTKSLGFKVEIGKFMTIPSGLWLTNAPITAPTVFDSQGQPIYWDVKFEFEYYRMPTYQDLQSWMLINGNKIEDTDGVR